MKPDNDHRLNLHEIPPPTRNGRAMVDGEASADPIDVVAARYRLTHNQAEEIFQYFDESMNSGDDMTRGSLSQAVGDALRERDKQWVLWLGKIFSVLDVYTAKQANKKFVRMSITTMMHIMGYGDESGVSSFAGIALKFKMPGKSGKQTVCKCAALFLEKLKLAPMLSQRTEAARAEMARARTEQLKK